MQNIDKNGSSFVITSLLSLSASCLYQQNLCELFNALTQDECTILDLKHLILGLWYRIPAGIYLFKNNNGNTITMCEIGSKVTIKTLDRCH